MSTNLLNFLSTLTLGSEDDIYTELENILSDNLSLFNFIKTDEATPLTSGIYSGESASGHKLDFNLTIPIELHSPPPLPHDLFHYSETAFGFEFHPKVNHLPTFDINQLYSNYVINSVNNEIERKTLLKLATEAQYQSRVTSIWRQSAAMIALLRAIYPATNIVRRYYRLLLEPYRSPPFYEKGQQIVWEQTSVPTISALPLLLHGAGHLTIMMLTSVYHRNRHNSLYPSLATMRKDKLSRHKIENSEGAAKFSPPSAPSIAFSADGSSVVSDGDITWSANEECQGTRFCHCHLPRDGREEDSTPGFLRRQLCQGTLQTDYLSSPC